MKRYFYVQATEEELTNENTFDIQALIVAPEDIYIDNHENTKWQELKQLLNEQDELYTHSVGTLSLDTTDFMKKLQFIAKHKIRLFEKHGQELHISEILETVEFLSTRARYMNRRKQLKGIERSLEKKKTGEGRYGRPKVQVPENFGEQIRYMTEHKISLESYRQSLDIKRSTFYRLVREVKDSWKKY